MAAFNKFNVVPEHIVNKVHDLFGSAVGTDVDAVKVYLSNEAPLAADTVKADIAEIATGNGYTGAVTVTPNGTRSGATFTLDGTKVVITASGGTIGPFQYVVLYNDTPGTPLDPVMGYWDRGAALTLQDGESFSIKFSNSDTTGAILTLA